MADKKKKKYDEDIIGWFSRGGKRIPIRKDEPVGEAKKAAKKYGKTHTTSMWLANERDRSIERYKKKDGKIIPQYKNLTEAENEAADTLKRRIGENANKGGSGRKIRKINENQIGRRLDDRSKSAKFGKNWSKQGLGANYYLDPDTGVGIKESRHGNATVYESDGRVIAVNWENSDTKGKKKKKASGK